MGPMEVEGNGFVIGFKPVGSEGGTGTFKDVKGFPSCFDFVIAFSTSHSSCPEASMVTGSFEAGSGSPGKALGSGLR